MTEQPRDAPQFFMTAPSACPYLPGQQERKVFTHVVGKRAPELNDLLTHGGFRRSQTIAYRPSCENCRACVSVRVLVREFLPSRNMRRVMQDNADLAAQPVPPRATSEQYSLFRDYLDARHASGGMADMSVLDYAMMVEDSHIRTNLIEYRLKSGPRAGVLVGVALTDVLGDGLSMVYSFYDPAEEARSFGTYMILDHIERARDSGLPYVYLGYWVDGSRKMAYKARFMPQERLGSTGWDRVDV